MQILSCLDRVDRSRILAALLLLMMSPVEFAPCICQLTVGHPSAQGGRHGEKHNTHHFKQAQISLSELAVKTFHFETFLTASEYSEYPCNPYLFSPHQTVFLPSMKGSDGVSGPDPKCNLA